MYSRKCAVCFQEFLYQNGAEGSGELPNTADSGAASKYMGRYAVAHKGFLYKTGPDNRGKSTIYYRKFSKI